MCVWVCGGFGVVGLFIFFFFQAEDGIRDAQESRGLGDVYKRQTWLMPGTSMPRAAMSVATRMRTDPSRKPFSAF